MPPKSRPRAPSKIQAPKKTPAPAPAPVNSDNDEQGEAGDGTTPQLSDEDGEEDLECVQRGIDKAKVRAAKDAARKDSTPNSKRPNTDSGQVSPAAAGTPNHKRQRSEDVSRSATNLEPHADQDAPASKSHVVPTALPVLAENEVMAESFIWDTLEKPDMSALARIIAPLLAKSPYALCMENAGAEETKARNDAARLAAITTDIQGQGKFYDRLARMNPSSLKTYQNKIKRIAQQFSKVCREMTRRAMRTIFASPAAETDPVGLRHVRKELGLTETPIFNETHPVIADARNIPSCRSGMLVIFPSSMTANEGIWVFQQGGRAAPVLRSFHDAVCQLGRLRPNRPEAEGGPRGSLTALPFLPEDGIKVDDPLFNAFTGYMWNEWYTKFPHMKRYLLPGTNESWDDVFDRRAPDGEFFINERLLAFLDYNVAASLAGKLSNDDVMEHARGVYQARVKGYQRRATPVPKKNQSASGGPQEFLPTWREELKAVLKAYAAVAVAGAQRRTTSGGASVAGADQPTDEEDMYGAM